MEILFWYNLHDWQDLDSSASNEQNIEIEALPFQYWF